MKVQMMPSFYHKDVSNETILMILGFTFSITLIHSMIGSFPAAVIGGVTGLYVCWRETSTTA